METQDNGAEIAAADFKAEQKATKDTAQDINRKLRTVQEAHEKGQPVYREMADRMEARRKARAEAIIDEALDRR
jgi:ribosomal protein L18E